MTQSTPALREAWRAFECAPEKMTIVSFGPDRIRVAPEAADAFRALAQVLTHHKYMIRTTDTDSYSCRASAGGGGKSLHSFGIAVDVNWDTNPWIDHPGVREVRFSKARTQSERAAEVRRGIADTDMTPEMVQDALRIKTKAGQAVFEWGGNWNSVKDAMHFEIDLTPSELASGIDWQTVPAAAPATSQPFGAPISVVEVNGLYKVNSRRGLNLREGPGQEFPVTTLLPVDTSVTVLGMNGDWAVVDLEGDGKADGHVMMTYLSPKSAGDSVGAQESRLSVDAGAAVLTKFVETLDEDVDELDEDNSLVPVLNLAHQPMPNWRIEGPSGPKGNYTYRFDGSNGPIDLGRAFPWKYETPAWTALGLARTSQTLPKLQFVPEDYAAEFGGWPSLIYPTSCAESNAQFLVVNAWDAAAMTFGFAQLAAHTADDLIPLFKTLLQELPAEAAQWFPEIGIVKDKLAFVGGDKYVSLEVARAHPDGAPSKKYYRGNFMHLLNPNRRAVDQAELHAAARWIEWTRQSTAMRRIQVRASIDNMKASAKKLHNRVLALGKAKFPNGIDGLRCDWLAAAIAVPHLAPGKTDEAVNALLAAEPLEAFKVLNYGPGQKIGRGTRPWTVVEGVKARPDLANMNFDLAMMKPR